MNFIGQQRWKTRIMQSRAAGGVRDALLQRVARFDYADAAVEFSMDLESYENTAMQREAGWLGRGLDERRIFQRADDRGARQRQHGTAVTVGELAIRKGQHPRTSRELPSCATFCAV